MAPYPQASPLEGRPGHECDGDREATEMREYDEVLRRSSVHINTSARMPCASTATPNGAYFPSMWKSLAKLWQRQVSATVPHDACRDHFVPVRFRVHSIISQSIRNKRFVETWTKNLLIISFTPALERTFLGYLRTSVALSMVSVIMAQLFRLEHAQNPNKVFGYFTMGIPLACVCIGAAIVVLLLGAYRFWRQQNAILRGKVHAGGWEMNAIGLMIAWVVLTLFVLLVTADSRKDSLDAT